jgi:hypothetical protein
MNPQVDISNEEQEVKKSGILRSMSMERSGQKSIHEVDKSIHEVTKM